MKKLQLHNLENKFLSPEFQEIQKFAFYAKFLVLPNFGDGWKYQMQKQLLDYLANLDFSEDEQIDLKIEKQETQQEIFAILKAENLNEETAKKIIEISTTLQQKYRMTPVLQKTGFSGYKGEDLKIVLEDLEEEELGYERQKFQELYKEILVLESKINDLEYQLDIYKNIDDEITKTLKIHLKQSLDLLKQDLINKNEELEKLLVVLYQKLALKKDTNSTKTISKFQAETVVDFAEQGKQASLGVFELLKKSEEILEKNKLEQEKFFQKIEELLEIKGIEKKQVTKGVLTDCKFSKDDYLIKARVNGKENSNVYASLNNIEGFEIEGINQRLKSIKKLSEEAGILYSFIGEFESGKKSLFELEGDTYNKLEIDGYTEFLDVFGINVTDKKIISGAFSIFSDDKKLDIVNKVFVFKDGVYFVGENNALEELNGLIYPFKSLENDIKGYCYRLENYHIKLFLLDNRNNFNEFHIDGEYIESLDDFVYDEIFPNYGILNKNLFHKEDGKYKMLEIEGYRVFTYKKDLANINFDENYKAINGFIDNKYFYIENGEYKWFKDKEGYAFKGLFKEYLETDENGIPLYYQTKTKIIFKQNSGFKKLKINGIKSIDALENVKKTSEGIPLEGIVEQSGKKYRFYKTAGGSYQVEKNILGFKKELD